MNNYKRLNVAITRAKSLLIIVGNSRVLQKSDIWNKFIEYCYLNGAMAGDSRA
jgi:helicase MOV-10